MTVCVYKTPAQKDLFLLKRRPELNAQHSSPFSFFFLLFLCRPVSSPLPFFFLVKCFSASWLKSEVALTPALGAASAVATLCASLDSAVWTTLAKARKLRLSDPKTDAPAEEAEAADTTLLRGALRELHSRRGRC